MKNHHIFSIINFVGLCVVVFAVSLHFVFDSRLIGYVIFGLGLLCLVSLLPFKISYKNIWPDIVFGFFDNGVLAIVAIFGGFIGGTAGAIIGGVVGNAVTDGIAGVFEGLAAEKIKGAQRTVLGSAVGKMTGCLLGAGAVLIVAGFFGF
ncbi:MAG: hypothetical protein UX09_C0038G0005 [Candidatus Uhrbacteria bacterium GW2011_GWE2_45_35]|uniref:Uncharacterized protein n=2 Tax=Candidatus Uhriibacteriota TaxID=1752732 RepID=A0A0G1LIT2_9BACT|nr:MAG: hypothetical protein UW63_C0069G0003 [Candidatus Uhrbacteria bacterium GW2011_GWF2_44_350]KKU06913.1 MAG: hypothetical protein UX09_C0038G0005 [Candidatus Uhrbacteria bacterium GW2011_GWE2_45_35]HBR80885.1 hypothetical protein [Candidatus Uhrbacteria bacterium]HCU31415.1 hypothetical protein [Candidatus Uhrbacteria bacterium]